MIPPLKIDDSISYCSAYVNNGFIHLVISANVTRNPAQNKSCRKRSKRNVSSDACLRRISFISLPMFCDGFTQAKSRSPDLEVTKLVVRKIYFSDLHSPSSANVSGNSCRLRFRMPFICAIATP